MLVLTDLSELFINGILMMHERVGDFYGAAAKRWFVIRKNHMNDCFFLDMMRGKMELMDFWGLFCDDPLRPMGFNAECGPTVITPEYLNSLFFQEIYGEIDGTREIFEGIIAYPNTLRQHNRKMIEGQPIFVMVSDHIRECVDYLHWAHPKVFDLFSQEIWSFERGEIKSDPGFFDRLLDDLGIRARDAIFVDDLLVNCEAATRAHIKAICYTGSLDLITSLEYNGFVIDRKVKAKYSMRGSMR